MVVCRDRKTLEARRQDGVDEMLMVTREGEALEGLVSNLFVVRNGVVFTAGERVLLGQMRSLVLDCCSELNIPICIEAPRLSDLNEWDECFLTSMSHSL